MFSRKRVLIVLLVMSVLAAGLALLVAAQSDGLVVNDDVVVLNRRDPFDQLVQVASGSLTNNSDTAYTGVMLFASVYDRDDALIGEGIGFLVNACGAGLLPDYAMQPGATQRFDVQLEMFADDDAVIDDIQIIAEGTPTEPTPATDTALTGITRVSDAEVIAVEWIDARALRFAAGCPRDPFTAWTWQQHSLRTDATIPVVHPATSRVTTDLLARINLDEPDQFAEAAIYFAPGGDRALYQDDINTLRSVQADGQFPRLIYDSLHNRTLRGYYWFGDGNRFLAYYFGAFGDPVIYFTATAEAQALSLPPEQNPPSAIIPGVAPDGVRAVIAGTFADTTGYFYKLLSQRAEPSLLFEADPAGNNYPPPLFTADDVIYLARPVDGQPVMQCLTLDDRTPQAVTPLPLDLATEDRALWWLSPDGATVALAANGTNGGLWLIDLAALPTCASPNAES